MNKRTAKLRPLNESEISALQKRRSEIWLDLEPLVYDLERQGEIVMVLIDANSEKGLVEQAVVQMVTMAEELKAAFLGRAKGLQP